MVKLYTYWLHGAIAADGTSATSKIFKELEAILSRVAVRAYEFFGNYDVWLWFWGCGWVRYWPRKRRHSFDFLGVAYFVKIFRRFMGMPCNLIWWEVGKFYRFWLLIRLPLRWPPTYLSERDSCAIKEPLPITVFVSGSGGSQIVSRLVVMERGGLRSPSSVYILAICSPLHNRDCSKEIGAKSC